MNKLQKTALALVIIGALNWGLVGILSFDLVAFLFGSLSMLSRGVYVIICLAGLYSLSIFAIERVHDDVEEHEIEEHKIVRHDEIHHKDLHRA